MKKLFLAAVFCVLAGGAGCGSGVHDVKYTITGEAATVHVQAIVDGGKIYDKTGVSLPWEKLFSANRKMDLFLTVTSEADGAFTVQMLIDEVLVDEASGSKAGDKVDLQWLAI